MKELTELLGSLEVKLLEFADAKRAGEFDAHALEVNVDETLDETVAKIRKLMGISDE